MTNTYLPGISLGKLMGTFQMCSLFTHWVWAGQISGLLGSNDPNTIPDPTRIRYSRFCILLYVSARTPFLFGLSYVYVSFGLRDSPVTFSRDSLDICFMLYLSPFPYVSLVRTMFHTFTFSDSAVTLDPSLLYFAYRTQIPFSYPAR